MFSTINQEKVDEFMRVFDRMSILSVAIKTCEKENIPTEVFRDFTIEFTQLKKDKQNLEFELLADFIDTNILKFKDNWYGIVFYKNRVRKLFLAPIKEDVDFKELENIVSNKSFIPEHDLSLYRDLNEDTNNRNRVCAEALKLVHEVVSGNSNRLLVSHHAYMRWEERVANKKLSRTDAIKAIEEDFDKAKKVYTSSEAEFYLNEDSMVFYCVKNKNVLVSLWINSFEPIEYPKLVKNITLLQLEYLNDLQQNIENQKKDNNKQIEEFVDNTKKYAEEIQQFKSEIESLQQQIADKEALIEHTIKTKEELLVKNEELDKKLISQEDILFTKFRMDLKNYEEEEKLSEIELEDE